MESDFRKEKYWKLVEEFVQELKTAKYWLKNDSQPLPAWKLFETRTAARDAAWDATSDATSDAAWDVARTGQNKKLEEMLLKLLEESHDRNR